MSLQVSLRYESIEDPYFSVYVTISAFKLYKVCYILYLEETQIERLGYYITYIIVYFLYYFTYIQVNHYKSNTVFMFLSYNEIRIVCTKAKSLHDIFLFRTSELNYNFFIKMK